MPTTDGTRRALWQFTVTDLLCVLLTTGLILALARYCPAIASAFVFVACSSLLILSVLNGLEAVVAGWHISTSAPNARRRAIWAFLDWVSRPLRAVENCGDTWAWPVILFLSTLAVFCGLWRLFVIVGVWLSWTANSGWVSVDPLVWSRLSNESITDEREWAWTITYAAGAMLRWVLLYGVVVAVLSVWWHVRQTDAPNGRGTMVRRLLLFAPWLAVLEMSLLGMLWATYPLSMPEPSALYLAGVESWDTWNWSCWLDEQWLWRATVPTLVVSIMFLRKVCRLPWWGSLICAPAFVPPAILLSIAWSLLFLNSSGIFF
jgi:hypothetical protein